MSAAELDRQISQAGAAVRPPPMSPPVRLPRESLSLPCLAPAVQSPLRLWLARCRVRLLLAPRHSNLCPLPALARGLVLKAVDVPALPRPPAFCGSFCAAAPSDAVVCPQAISAKQAAARQRMEKNAKIDKFIRKNPVWNTQCKMRTLSRFACTRVADLKSIHHHFRRREDVGAQ